MKTIIIGLDAFDPKKFESLHAQGKTPHLSKYVEQNGYARFGVSNPAQSEVSWTSIATGQNPGGHGMFDFVHRDPRNYGIQVSLLPSRKTMVGLQFAPPHSAETIFDHAVSKGYPATSLWWPATFPARLTSPITSIPGLGTPDIAGKIGVGILFAASDLGADAPAKTQIEKLVPQGSGKFSGELVGPPRKKGKGIEESQVPFTLNFQDETTAEFTIGKQVFTLKEGEWGPVIETGFKMSLLITLKTVTRPILIKGKSDPQLYFVPLQIHPLSSAWPYGAPRNFLKKTWNDHGPFLTLGWPQDTTGLNEGILTDKQFLDLCDSIFATREKIFNSQLDNFREGVLGIVFDTMDRVQHMFWKNNPDVVEDWYLKLDALIGRLENKIMATGNQDAQILILSDHGFANFDHKVNLNKWLVDEGFISTRQPDATNLDAVNWQETNAYAVGLNSLYLNKAGREGSGILTDETSPAIIDKLKTSLLRWKGPDGNPVVSSVKTNQEAFDGPLAHLGPDLLVGYAPGYRASADTGIGNWSENQIEQNNDHWNADHCIDPDHVQGVIFRNSGLTDYPNPSYKDIPGMVVGKSLKPGEPPTDMDQPEEDRDAVEERLKGLGYL